jgi:hypothetical protein
MRRTFIVIAIGASVALFWLAAVGPLASQPGPGGKGPAAPKWEYAVLVQTGADLLWQTPTKTISARTWKDLGKELGIAQESNTAYVLTKIGGEGWELVSHAAVATGAQGPVLQTQTWTFKRPVK